MSELIHPAPLSDFEERQITLLNETRPVFASGSGPAVIVMSEMPGIYSHVAQFARRVRDAGFTVYMPHLFGEVGRPPSGGYLMKSIAKACIRVLGFCRQPFQPNRRLAASSSQNRPRRMWWSRGRRHRHVLYRKFCAEFNARASGTGTCAFTALPATV